MFTNLSGYDDFNWSNNYYTVNDFIIMYSRNEWFYNCYENC